MIPEITCENILLTDLHMHTSFSDGKDSPADMLRSAARKGLKNIGISDHSYTFFDESYCIARERVGDYLNELMILKEKCSDLKNNSRFARALGTDEINLYAGIEQDYYSTYPADGFDYRIGSVHYIRLNDDGRDIPEGCLKYMDQIYIPIDESKEILLAACRTFYGGDIYSLIEDYFLVEGDCINVTGADIIGHFDLISKFNEDGTLFDRSNSRYRDAWQHAASKLLKTDALFEINTGAMSRGYRTSPYPDADIISYIKERKGRFILSSDSHCSENIAFSFNGLLKYLNRR